MLPRTPISGLLLRSVLTLALWGAVGRAPAQEAGDRRPAPTASGMDPEAFKAWAGPGADPAPFQAYAAARAQDPWAAAQEPHRTWLMGITNTGTPATRLWAFARLFEADARPAAGEPHPALGYLQTQSERLMEDIYLFPPAAQSETSLRAWSAGGPGIPLRVGQILGPKMREIFTPKDRPEPMPPLPWEALGHPLADDLQAPGARRFHDRVLGQANLGVSMQMYAALAPLLEPADGPAILALFRKAATASAPKEPLRDFMFMLASDWLIAFGQAGDWKAFRTGLSKDWDEPLAELWNALSGLKAPGPWSLSGAWSQGKGEALPPEANPETPLPAGSWTHPAVKARTFMAPDYPRQARNRLYGGRVRVLATVGTEGKPTFLRVQPGYSLGMFAPAALGWVGKWTFEPARLDGLPQVGRHWVEVQFVIPVEKRPKRLGGWPG